VSGKKKNLGRKLGNKKKKGGKESGSWGGPPYGHSASGRKKKKKSTRFLEKNPYKEMAKRSACAILETEEKKGAAEPAERGGNFIQRFNVT